MTVLQYLDSNVFVYAAASSDPEGDVARRVLHEVATGAQPAATSTLTIDEVVWGLKRVTDRATAIRHATRILTFPNLAILDVRARHMVGALDLMERHERLDPRDAVHAAVAIDAGIFTIVSADADFDGLAGVERVPLRAR